MDFHHSYKQNASHNTSTLWNTSLLQLLCGDAYNAESCLWSNTSLRITTHSYDDEYGDDIFIECLILLSRQGERREPY